MNKQIEKAKAMLSQPSKVRRIKFISNTENKMLLNEKLIEKTSKLLGIKGYYTDIEETVVSSKTIIARYHQLYKIEQAFRVSKNDLRTRPIFHFKEDPIKLHILICFMALVISKHIEINSTMSIKAFTDRCKKVSHGRLINKINKKELLIKSKVPDDLAKIIHKLVEPH